MTTLNTETSTEAHKTTNSQDAGVTAGLNRLLASATVFYQKVRHYHWNVTGPHFFALHEEFEDLYTAWNGAIDDIAEQVRARGDRPVHTLADVLDLSSLEEDPATPPADDMVRVIVADLMALREEARTVIEQAEADGDAGTIALLEDLRDHIEENRWMLQAWLQDL